MPFGLESIIPGAIRGAEAGAGSTEALRALDMARDIASAGRGATSGARDLAAINADIARIRGDLKGIDEAVGSGNMTEDIARNQRRQLAIHMQGLQQEAAQFGSTGTINATPTAPRSLPPETGAPPIMPPSDPYSDIYNQFGRTVGQARDYIADRYTPVLVRDPETGRVIQPRNQIGQFQAPMREHTLGQTAEMYGAAGLGVGGLGAGAGYLYGDHGQSGVPDNRYNQDTPPPPPRSAPSNVGVPDNRYDLDTPSPQDRPELARPLAALAPAARPPMPQPRPAEFNSSAGSRATRKAPLVIPAVGNAAPSSSGVLQRIFGNAAAAPDTYATDPNDPSYRAAFFQQERERGYATGGQVTQSQQQQPNKEAALHKALEIIHHLISRG